MTDSVVVGVDGREGGVDAIALARALAPRARLTLVTAYGYTSFPPMSGGLEVLAESLEQGALEMLQRAAAEHAPGAELRALAYTPVGEALHRIAAETGAGLIVIGSASRGAAGRVLVGDDSRATLHGAPVAVAIAPHGYAGQARPPASILVGFNTSAESHAALKAASAIAAEHGAALRLAVVVEEPHPVAAAYAYAVDWPSFFERERGQARALLDRTLGDLPAGADGEVLMGRPADELLRLADEAGLLVVGSRGWGPVRRVLLGSTTDRLVHEAPCPVLAVPRPGDSED
jgi:nucleotide-binding universal stress UspA family protein